MMDYRFAKVVTDVHGKDHMLIDGQILTLEGPACMALNAITSGIVSALRQSGGGFDTGPTEEMESTVTPGQI